MLVWIYWLLTFSPTRKLFSRVCWNYTALVYYAGNLTFNYQARFERRKRIEFDSGGHFVITEAPRLFKLRMNSDLATPYGNPMQGRLIYLNQHPRPGVLISTLGLEADTIQT